MTKNNSNFGEPGKVLKTEGLEKIDWKESTWQEIEEEFRKKFPFAIINWGEDEKAHDKMKDILAFFKPYFQEKMHTEAVEELEVVDNSKL